MNYELTKKLRDSGFPQCGSGEWEGDDDGKIPTYIPTLSELIAACGDKFSCLGVADINPQGYFTFRGWQAVGEHARQNGTTPEEAVANLYLALNVKTTP